MGPKFPKHQITETSSPCDDWRGVFVALNKYLENRLIEEFHFQQQLQELSDIAYSAAKIFEFWDEFEQSPINEASSKGSKHTIASIDDTAFDALIIRYNLLIKSARVIHYFDSNDNLFTALLSMMSQLAKLARSALKQKKTTDRITEKHKQLEEVSTTLYQTLQAIEIQSSHTKFLIKFPHSDSQDDNTNLAKPKNPVH
jgi:hypothetical protein